MGGEKLLTCERIDFRLGSPPRGRGKGFTKSFEEHGFGITPRVGGEKISVPSIQSGAGGSPPRGRGKVKGTGQIAVRSRITPAWAGKSYR